MAIPQGHFYVEAFDATGRFWRFQSHVSRAARVTT